MNESEIIVKDEHYLKELVKVFFKKRKEEKLMSEKENEKENLLNSLVSGFVDLKKNVDTILSKFDSNKDGKMSLDEIKQMLKNPISKRYLLVFAIVSVNIVVAIIQFYLLGKSIDVGTLITLIFTTATVLFGGYIENANNSIIQLKDMEIDDLKNQLLESHKNGMNKDSEISILKKEIEYQRK